jgi:hypothetical protein
MKTIFVVADDNGADVMGNLKGLEKLLIIDWSSAHAVNVACLNVTVPGAKLACIYI